MKRSFKYEINLILKDFFFCVENTKYFNTHTHTHTLREGLKKLTMVYIQKNLILKVGEE